MTYSEVPNRMLDSFIYMVNDSTGLGSTIGQYIWFILGAAIIIVLVKGVRDGIWLK